MSESYAIVQEKPSRIDDFLGTERAREIDAIVGLGIDDGHGRR